MERVHTTPVHPGEVLEDELKELSLSQSSLAQHIGVSPEVVSELCQGQRELNASMAMKLSRALGASPQFWLNLQNNWELSQIDEADYAEIEPVMA